MAKMSKELRLIPVELIITNKNQPRQYFDDETISELAESIKSVGIIQPLSVRENENGKFDLKTFLVLVVISKFSRYLFLVWIIS